ncbi:unnamed protein product [Withania somnifera]
MKYQDNQHFSHHHILKSLVLNESEQLQCQACEQPIFEPFHGCISCNFYLHDNCLNVPRSLVHPSHPSHPLTLLPTPTYSSRSFTCNACGSEGRSCSLSCAHCEFDLQVHCALFPRTILLTQHHHHELKLIFDSPFDHEDESMIFVCDLCHGKTEQNYWLYNCAECDFGTHIECGIPKNVKKPKENAVMITKPKEEPVISRPTKSSVRKTEKKSAKNPKMKPVVESPDRIPPQENEEGEEIIKPKEEPVLSAPTRSPIRKAKKKSAKNQGENPKTKPVSESSTGENSTDKLPEENEGGGEVSSELTYYQAQRRLKEQHIENMLTLQALDNAASYVAPSRGYYYY